MIGNVLGAATRGSGILRLRTGNRRSRDSGKKCVIELGKGIMEGRTRRECGV